MTEQITTEAKLARAEQYGVLQRIPLHNRGGPKGMLPSTWMGHSLRVEYVHAYSGGRETSKVLLDWCPMGPVLNVRGAGTLVTWDRLCLCELAEG
jgi:hypothetical protein